MSRHREVDDRRPQPVLQAGWVSALATALTALLVSWLARRGLLLPDELAEPIADVLELGIVAAAGALSTLWAALWARRRVTPLRDPRQADGTPLRPVPRARTTPIRSSYPPRLDDADTDVLPRIVD